MRVPGDVHCPRHRAQSRAMTTAIKVPAGLRTWVRCTKDVKVQLAWPANIGHEADAITNVLFTPFC